MGNSLYSQINESIDNANYEQFDNILKKLPPNYSIDNISEYSILHSIIKTFDKDGNTLLINSIIENDYNIARFLIKNGANPNIPNRKNYKTPLVYASQTGRTNFVILLLKQNGIIIQPNSITITTNEDIKTLIKNN